MKSVAKILIVAAILGQPAGAQYTAMNAGAAGPVVQALRPAATKPLSKAQLLELLAGGVPNQRAMELVKERGIDFQADDEYVKALRTAGANSGLIAAVREASAAALEHVTIETSPNAEVLLDGNSQGRADAQGELAMDVRLGDHTLRVTLAGKLDFDLPVTIAGGQPIKINAPLADAMGSVRVKTMPGAGIALDSVERGAAGGTGELVLDPVTPGAHEVRISAPGKIAQRVTVQVAAGAETAAAATLADSMQVNPRDGVPYVWIPAGTFRMGCSPGDRECADVESPAHPVTLTRGYWMAQTEVMVGAYKVYAKAAGHSMPPSAPRAYKGWKVERLPVVDVTWDEARQYCAWADGRLPTEAEWEYAARGGSPNSRYGDLEQIAWYRLNSGNETHEVGEKVANPFGLFDTLGNVWEWVDDWFDKNYFSASPSADPPGPASGTNRILRGGSRIEDPKLLRASDRYYSQPGARSDFFGFRCVWAGPGR